MTHPPMSNPDLSATNQSDLHAADTEVTRLIRADVTAPSTDLLLRAGRVATSVTVLLGESPAIHASVTTALVGLPPRGLRVELQPVADRHGQAPSSPVRPLPDGMSWHPVRRPLGGRAMLLAEAVESAAHEFVIVGDSVGAPVAGLRPALGHMWAEGCDAALVGPIGADDLGSPDPAGVLSSWLSGVGIRAEGTLVVLRRWVARWLFNEVARAVDPWVEVADRARLLGIGILAIDPSADRAPTGQSLPGV
jgi:hypothetical protein